MEETALDPIVVSSKAIQFVKKERFEHVRGDKIFFGVFRFVDLTRRFVRLP